jgi:hypothetical protein
MVIIPYAYAGTETIAAIVGGQGTLLRDDRIGHMQLYVWNGSRFVPADFVQLSGFVAEGMAARLPASIAMGYDPSGTSWHRDGKHCCLLQPHKRDAGAQHPAEPGERDEPTHLHADGQRPFRQPAHPGSRSDGACMATTTFPTSSTFG